MNHQQIVMDTQQLRQTMVDIEARHADIMALEKNIKELHDLFIDMATLIEQQGDKIDRIENLPERISKPHRQHLLLYFYLALPFSDTQSAF